MPSSHAGKILIISSPSGGGKTSICRRLLSPARRRQGWAFSVSYTTRQRRPGERNGREYHFVSDERFEQLVRRDFFAEHFRVHQSRYGTPRGPLEKVRHRGGVMVLDVDVNGALSLKCQYPDAIMVFVMPPSRSALRRRLRRRGTETEAQLALRLQNAIHELSLFVKFDYVVINQRLDAAVRQVLAIIESHVCRIENIPKEQLARIAGLR